MLKILALLIVSIQWLLFPGLVAGQNFENGDGGSGRRGRGQAGDRGDFRARGPGAESGFGGNFGQDSGGFGRGRRGFRPGGGFPEGGFFPGGPEGGRGEQGFGGGGFGGDGFGGGGFGGGGFGGERRSSRFNSMIDRDGDGVIQQEEIDRMPEFMRNMLSSRGIELRTGMSVDEFQQAFRGGFSGRGGRDGSEWPDGEQPEKKIPLKPYKQKEPPRITVELPPRWSQDDSDFDGQLAFHEWLATRREDLAEFDRIDTDGDGFLTPEELLEADSAEKPDRLAPYLTSVQAERLVIVGPREPTSEVDVRGGAEAGNSEGGPVDSGADSRRGRRGRGRDAGGRDGGQAPADAQQN